MDTKAGYYSIMQYCPDYSRAEVANVGVILFCPSAGFLRAQLSRGHGRIVQIFGKGSFERTSVTAAEEAIANRLVAEEARFRDVEDLREFARRRMNEILLTDPRPVRLLRDPDAELKQLFRELVQKEPRKAAEPKPFPELDKFFHEPRFRGKVRLNCTVEVPISRRRIEVPYTYKNGAMKLIKPLVVRDTRDSRDAILCLACEGDLLQKEGLEGCDVRMSIVTSPAGKGGEEALRQAVAVFKRYAIRAWQPEDVPQLKEQVEKDLA